MGYDWQKNMYGDTYQTYTPDPEPNPSYEFDLGPVEDYLNSLFTGQSESIRRARANMMADISEASQRAEEQTRARLAQSGLYGTGLGEELFTQLAGQKERAIAKGEQGILAQEEAAKRYAAGQLTNIENMKASNWYREQQLNLARERFEQQKDFQDWQRMFQERQYNDMNEDKWWALGGELFGDVLSAAALAYL